MAVVLYGMLRRNYKISSDADTCPDIIDTYTAFPLFFLVILDNLVDI